MNKSKKLIVKLYPTDNMVPRLSEIWELYLLNRRYGRLRRVWALWLALRREVPMHARRSMIIDNLGLTVDIDAR